VNPKRTRNVWLIFVFVMLAISLSTSIFPSPVNATNVINGLMVAPAMEKAGDPITLSSAAAAWPAGDFGAPCTLTTVGSFNIIASYSCLISSVGTLSGSFTVSGTVPGGPYTLTATGAVLTDTASAAFTVQPTAGLSTSSGSPPVSGSPGAAATAVTVVGAGFKSTDTGCTLASSDLVHFIIDQ
jgi:hypothetical protein